MEAERKAGATGQARSEQVTAVKFVVGTGPEDATMRRMNAERCGHAEFLGYRSGDELHSLIRGALAVVLPSEWYENAPMSVLESFALGKPVIVENKPGAATTLAAASRALEVAAEKAGLLSLEPVMTLLNAIPRVVLAPLFVIWLGIGIASKIALSFILVAVLPPAFWGPYLF